MLLFFLVGFLLVPHSAEAASGGRLYDQVKAMVESEHVGDTFDAEVTTYVRALLRQRLRNESGATAETIAARIPSEEDIRVFLGSGWTDVCARLQGRNGPLHRLECHQMMTDVRRMVADEMRVRRLGRELQAEATGYEWPMTDLPGRSAQMTSDLRGILSVWGAGGGAIASADTGARTRDVSFASRVEERAETFRGLFATLAATLLALDREQHVAAVWRYQYGVRLVRQERAPHFLAPHAYLPVDSGSGTERQYLFHRWNEDGDVEDALLAIWREVQSAIPDRQVFSSPLAAGETALITFPQELMDLLPDNVLLWARLDGDYAHMHPMGDVGLQWIIPLEPVLPSLVWEEHPILGGSYPPEPVRQELSGALLLSLPVNGTGLCSTPAGMRGYLCRPVEALAAEEHCPLPAHASTDAIRLTWCASSGSLQRFTAGGADVCREIAYQTSASSPVEPTVRTACKLDIRCMPDCTIPDSPAHAMTYPKQNDGTVAICMRENSSEFTATHLLFHELVHASYLCGLPPGQGGYRTIPDGASPAEVQRIAEANNALCCEMEGVAYRAQCDLMERDGVFAGAPIVDGIPLTAETCAEAFTDSTCRTREGLQGCYVSGQYTDAFLQAALQRSRTHNPQNVPDTCSRLVSHESNQPTFTDQRIAGFVQDIEASTAVCTPGTVSRYPNRIGNNLCFIGQCVEQSVERARLTPSRSPSVAGGATGVWDDPRTGTPLGTLLTQSSSAQVRFVEYQPALLMRAMETALCQVQGLPPRTPPIRCALTAQRQLGLERVMNPMAMFGMQQQNAEQFAAFTDILSLSPALGTRVGTALYARYLADASRSFASLFATAADLLTEITTVRFPTQMCPLGPGLPSLVP